MQLCNFTYTIDLSDNFYFRDYSCQKSLTLTAERQRKPEKNGTKRPALNASAGIECGAYVWQIDFHNRHFFAYTG